MQLMIEHMLRIFWRKNFERNDLNLIDLKKRRKPYYQVKRVKLA